jgi:hypothetical protein
VNWPEWRIGSGWKILGLQARCGLQAAEMVSRRAPGANDTCRAGVSADLRILGAAPRKEQTHQAGMSSDKSVVRGNLRLHTHKITNN